MTHWNDRFLALAHHVAGWSKDPSTKVGAVIVDPQKRVVGMGFNGFPRGVDDDPARYAERALKYKLVVHAEANAILNATASVVGCTLYATLFPCHECAKLIVQAGIAKVVAPFPELGRWSDSHSYSDLMFSEAGVEVELMSQGSLPCSCCADTNIPLHGKEHRQEV